MARALRLLAVGGGLAAAAGQGLRGDGLRGVPAEAAALGRATASKMSARGHPQVATYGVAQSLPQAASQDGQDPAPSSVRGIALAAVGGSLSATGSNVMAWATHQSRSGARQWTAKQSAFFSVVCIAMNLSGIALFGLSCTLGGAVSTVMPIQTGMNLLTNMFWQVFLGIKHYEKSMRLGTFVLICAVAQLGELGPDAPPDPDVMALLSATKAKVCVGTLVVLTIVFLGACMLTARRSLNSASKLCSFTMLVSLTTVIGSSLLKCLSLLHGWALMAAIGSLLVVGVLNIGFTVLANAYCDVSLFIPAQLSSQLVINMITGDMVWRDSDYIDKPVAYLLVYVLCVMGVYLISPEMDVLGQLAQRYWVKRTHLSAGVAPTQVSAAVQRLLAAWRCVDGRREVADPRHAALCQAALREVLERASEAGVIKTSELIDLAVNVLQDHGPGPSAAVVHWIENKVGLFRAYIEHDQDFRLMFRKTLSEAEVMKLMNWPIEESAAAASAAEVRTKGEVSSQLQPLEASDRDITRPLNLR